MKKSLLFFTVLLFVIGSLSSQTTIAFQGFEAGDSWTISSGGANTSATAGNSDFPSNSRIRTGSFSWQQINGTSTLELASISTTGFNDIKVTAYISSTALTSGNGSDGADEIEFSVALNGGSFPGTADIEVEGNNNAKWTYAANLTASTTAGTPTTVNAPQGGNNANNYAKVEITIPNGTTSVALKVRANNNSSNEIWNLDDIELTGTSASGEPLISFDATTSSVVEGTGSNTTHNVAVTMNTAPTLDVTVDVNNTNGNAGNGDYTLVTTSLTFLASDTYPVTQQVETTITGDSDIEGDEDFNLNLSLNTANDLLAEIGTNGTHTVTITNDDVAPAVIVINEFMYDAVDDGSSTSDEWVELYNNSGNLVDISCYVLTDGDWDVSIPSGTTIAANSWITIGPSDAKRGDGTVFTPDVEVSTCSCFSGTVMNLTNGGEFLALFDASANFVDGVIYGSPSGGNTPSGAGVESVGAQGGCPSTSVDIAGNASFTGASLDNRTVIANNFETIGATTVEGGTLGRYPDGSANFYAFTPSPDQTSPGAANFNILPIELVQFTATLAQNKVQLAWQTALEINNDYFFVQHSTDGRNFENITKIAGAGNSNELLHYHFEHASPANGLNYYRLEQVDIDGTSSFSTIKSVRWNDKFDIQIYPTIAQEELTIEFGEAQNGTVNAAIYNVNGQLMATPHLDNKAVVQKVNIADLPKGLYFITVISEQSQVTQRFVKQ